MTNNPIDLDALLAKRAEATGVAEGLVPFTFKGEQFTFRDHMSLTDDDVDELADLDHGADICAFYMGDDYERFIAAGGSSNLWSIAFQDHQRRSVALNEAGHPTRSNRSQRRAAARKR